jgi:hypothetical protein
MKLRRTLSTYTLLLLVSLASPAQAQNSAPSGDKAPADFNIEIWGYQDSITLQEFKQRVLEYANLRNVLQQGVPELKVTENPDEITLAEFLLARKIRAARPTATGGEIFTAAIATEFRELLLFRMDDRLMATIMDDNPGEFRRAVNGSYPKKFPLSTMPPQILILLPELPAGLEYRFVGSHLILRDNRANLIVDEMPDAILVTNLECGDGEDLDDCEENDAADDKDKR